MKQVFAFLLIVCISGQAFVRTAWTLHYQWNRAVYLKNCENRNKANLHCDGKCYLKKQMAASENSSQQAPQLPAGFHQIKDIQLYFEPSALLPHLNDAPVLAAMPLPYTRQWPDDAPLAGIFKPPTT